MLTEEEVIKRSIRWYVIAGVTKEIDGQAKSASIYSKASAYLDVLNLPWHKECGNKCRENLQEYADILSIKYINSNEKNLQLFMDENIDLNKWYN